MTDKPYINLDVANIQRRIADEVFPDGWDGECRICGKPFHYTREECAYYLAHGWPRCDHKKEGSPIDPLDCFFPECDA